MPANKKPVKVWNNLIFALATTYTSYEMQGTEGCFVRAFIQLAGTGWTTAVLTAQVMDSSGTWFDCYDINKNIAQQSFAAAFTGAIAWASDGTLSTNRSNLLPINAIYYRFKFVATGGSLVNPALTMWVEEFRLRFAMQNQ